MKQSDLDAFIFDLKASANFFIDDTAAKLMIFAGKHNLDLGTTSIEEVKAELKKNLYAVMAYDEMAEEFREAYVNE